MRPWARYQKALLLVKALGGCWFAEQAWRQFFEKRRPAARSEWWRVALSRLRCCYLLADHLGSSTQVLDSSGTLIESAKYYPYGSLRSGGLTLTDKEFTGQQHEGTAFGVYNYRARGTAIIRVCFRPAGQWQGFSTKVCC